MFEIDKLAQALRESCNAATQAEPGDDDGSCNLDQPVIRIPGAKGSATIRAAAQLAGVEVDCFEWIGGSWFFVRCPLSGMAEKRSRMAIAASRVLEELANSGSVPGLRATCWLQAD